MGMKWGEERLKKPHHGILHDSARRKEACLSESRSPTIAAECGVESCR